MHKLQAFFVANGSYQIEGLIECSFGHWKSSTNPTPTHCHHQRAALGTALRSEWSDFSGNLPVQPVSEVGLQNRCALRTKCRRRKVYMVQRVQTSTFPNNYTCKIFSNNNRTDETYKSVHSSAWAMRVNSIVSHKEQFPQVLQRHAKTVGLVLVGWDVRGPMEASWPL